MSQSKSQRSFFKDYLPTFDSAFVGRQAELLTLTSAVETRSFVTVVGPGGIGKTRLAVQSALDTSNAYSDGIVFVPLAAVSSRDAFVTTLNTTLHLQFGGKEDLFERILGYLDRRNILLILDNIESLLDHMDLISRLLRLTGPRWIITSRERLGLPDEVVLNLRGLPRLEEPFDIHTELPPAERLFVQSMRVVNHQFDPTAQDIEYIRRVCQLTEGMPLAIELAASWTRLLPVAFVANQIANNLDWLTSSLSINRGPQRSIRAVLDYFWDLLSAEEQAQLSQLAVFQGGFERAMAESLAHVSFFFLSALVQHAFLSRTTNGRYQLHEMLRQYAIERLNKNPEVSYQAHHRHAQFMVDLAQRLSMSDAADKPILRQAWLERMQPELPNLRAALNWAAEQHQYALMLDVLLPLENLWLMVTNYAELCDWIDQALQAGNEVKFSPQQHIAAGLLGGQCAEAISQFDRAAAYAAHALNFALPLNDAAHIVSANRLLGMVAYRQGRIDDAEQFANVALTTAKQIEDPHLVSQALRSLGMVLSARGNLSQALIYDQESLKIARELKNSFDIASSLNAAAIDMAWLGQHDDAIRYLEESLELHRALNYTDRESVSLMNLGWLFHLKQEPLKAETYYQQSLDILERIGDLDGLALTHLNIGDSMLARQAPVSEVAAHYHKGLNTAQRIHAWPTVMYGLVDAAKVALALQQWPHAATFLNMVLHHSTANETARTDAQPLLATLRLHYSDAPNTHSPINVNVDAPALNACIEQALQLLGRAV